jgi:hypothetical protein
VGVKVTRGAARVEVRRSSQEITAHAGLVLVRELAARLGLQGLLDGLSVKRRRRGFSPAQAVLAIVETLVAGGDCLEDSRLLGADGARSGCAATGCPTPQRWGAFCAASTSATSPSSTWCSTRCSSECTRWSNAAGRSRSTSMRATWRPTGRRARARARGAPTLAPAVLLHRGDRRVAGREAQKRPRRRPDGCARLP